VLVGVDERSAAVWQDGSWTAMGAGGVTVLRGDGRTRSEPGEPIDDLPSPLGA
jgi:hypothetical protein